MWKKLAKSLLLAVALAGSLAACTKVPSGYVGVQVEKYGDDRGVGYKVLTPGSYTPGWNTDVFLFPTFSQTKVWDKPNAEGEPDESFTFQTVEGLNMNTDVGITYAIPKDAAPKVFQKYRRGVDELTDTVIRSMVRDALNQAGSLMTVEDAYGKGKPELQAKIEKLVRSQASKIGVNVESVYFIGPMRPPATVMASINGKIAATQLAQQKENELRAAEADAAKQVALAKGEAEAMEIKGRAIRENSQVLQQLAIEKWNGVLPTYVGGSGPIPFVPVK